jgi:hypothetical protein
MSCLSHSEEYLMQRYVIEFVTDLRQFNRFHRVLRFPSKNKTDHHDITEISLTNKGNNKIT